MNLTQPKKPVGGAFGQYCNEKRPEFMKACAGQQASAVQKLAGAEWKKLSDEEKEPYQKKYEAAKKKFDKDMEAFLESGGEVVKKVRKGKKDKGGKKAKKDKDAPKRPAGGAYGQYLATKRQEIKKMLPADHKITDVTKKASELWKAVPESEKKKYETMFKTANDEFHKAMEEYKATKAANAPEPEAAAATPSPKKRKALRAHTGSASKKSAKVAKTPSVDLDEDVLKQAQAAGFESQLKNLAARADVAALGKKDADLLKALKASGGLVNPAKRALLGA